VPSLAAERDYYTDKLVTNGYVSVPFEVNGSDIDPLFAEFREFLDLCEQPGGKQFADALAFTPTARNSGGDYWVARRRLGEINPHSLNPIPSTENKDVAHIGPRSYQMAEERLGGRFGIPHVMHRFLSSCIELHEATKTSARPVLRALGLESSIFAESGQDDQHVVRLIRYLGTSASLKADLHFDRSAITVAAWESHSGLIGTPAQNAQRRSVDINELEAAAEEAHRTPIHHRSGSAKLFLGAGYNRLPDPLYEVNGELPLLLHGVRNEQPDEERDAVVVFMHPPANYPGYAVPTNNETGIDKVREFILRRKPAYADADVA
jgi:hypothetical protein